MLEDARIHWPAEEAVVVIAVCFAATNIFSFTAFASSRQVFFRTKASSCNRRLMLIDPVRKCISRHPGEGRGPGGESPPALDTGLRRYDGNFILYRTGSIVI